MSDCFRILMRLLLVVFAWPLLIGCMEESSLSYDGTLSIEVPRNFRQILAIDTNQLSANLIVNNRNVSLQSNGTNIWNANVMVPANSVARISVSWFENYQDVKIKLAESTQEIVVADQGASVVLSNEYVTTGSEFDNDNDGFFNLDERTRDSNPLDPNDIPGAQIGPPRELVNGNFEGPLGGLPGWSSCSGNNIRSEYDADSRTRFVSIPAGDCVLQAVTVTAGNEYSVSCDVAVTDTVTWSGLSIIFYESVTGNVVTELPGITVLSTDTYSRETLTGRAPTGATILLVTFYTESGARMDDCVLMQTG